MSLIICKYYDEVIGLGKYCQLTWYLRNRNLLSETRHIFDDMVSNKLSCLCDLIENKFDNFFSFSNLKKIEFNKWNRFTILDEANGITSVHDFKHDLDKQTHRLFIDEKMADIAKFFESIEQKDSLLFVRVNNPYEPLEQSVRLLEILRSIRKGKKFDLYVFQENDFAKKVVGMPNMNMFYDKQWDWSPELKWHGNIELWDAIFKHARTNKQSRIWKP